MQLAIDTATDIATIALVKDGQLQTELTWRTRRNHTVQLIPALDYLFQLSGSDRQDLKAIIIGTGPGSFNGLRVGVSAAKGLAYGLQIPIVGINSLEVNAYQYANTGLPVCPVINAGRSEVAAAIYRMVDGEWRCITPVQIITPAQLAAQIEQTTLFCGDFAGQIGPQLRELLGDRFLPASPLTDSRRAAWLAELGLQKLNAGHTDDIATLQPLYLRRPPITKSKKL